jgi:hypothetical protein
VALPVHAAHRDDGVIRTPHKRPVCRSVGFFERAVCPADAYQWERWTGPPKAPCLFPETHSFRLDRVRLCWDVICPTPNQRRMT